MVVALETANVSAHAVVTKSSLEDQAIAPQTATPVVLNFNSNIELSLSKVLLVSKGDVQRSVAAKPGKKPGQIVVQLPPLVAGKYALRYKVFAADGHLTEDIIYFEVDNH